MTHDAAPAGAAAEDQHPEVSEIADLAEDLLPPERSAALRTHLDRCAACGDLLASLEEVRGLLGDFPDPGPMPVDVAARIDAALTAEAASRPSAAADVSRETAPASPVQPHDVSRETAPASPVQPHDVSRETGLASPTRPHDVSRETHAPRPAPRRSRRHWPRRLLSTAATAAVLIAAGYGLHTFHTSEGSAGGDKSASVAQQPTLRERVQLLLHSTSAEDSAPSSGRAHTDASPRRSSGLPGAVSLPSCVRDALHRSDPPLAAAKEYYEGRLVYLVVLAHPGDSGKVDAFVVAASCAAASPGVRGTVLGRHTYTR